MKHSECTRIRGAATSSGRPMRTAYWSVPVPGERKAHDAGVGNVFERNHGFADPDQGAGAEGGMVEHVGFVDAGSPWRWNHEQGGKQARQNGQRQRRGTALRQGRSRRVGADLCQGRIGQGVQLGKAQAFGAQRDRGAGTRGQRHGPVGREEQDRRLGANAP